MEKERVEQELAQQKHAAEQRSTVLLAAQRGVLKGERERVQTQLQHCQDLLDRYQGFLDAQQRKWAQLATCDEQTGRRSKEQLTANVEQTGEETRSI